MINTDSGFLRAALLATSSLVIAGGWSPVFAAGGPTGGKVVAGSATITDPRANETLITQTSNKALIDWTSFSIPSGSIVDFKQPGSSSLTVNMVTGPNASQIDGELLANGAIWLLNSNGILFGRGSQVNVGSLLATTSDLSDSDFKKGRYHFSNANSNASVINRGTIDAADGGSVVLSASHVSNQGVIRANLGKVVLGGASAFTVDMVGDNLIRYQITTPVSAAPTRADGKPAAALVSNSGTISATGGSVVMTARAAKSVQDDVINNTGIVEATSAAAHDGEIVLDAGSNGTVDAGGTLDVSGGQAGETGGKIALTGNAVNVENGATLDAAGYSGGGTVLVGGGFHGKGEIADAATTVVGNATIDVAATHDGNGGRVAVWSNKETLFAGKINAQGGADGGNGGYVETSSGVSLEVALDAVVNASAAHGTKGSWLLDPLNIIIETGGTTQLDNGVLGLNTDSGKTDTIDPSTITNALATTNVLLEAANDITVLNDVIYSSADSLLLLAEHDIDAYANIQNTMASGGGGVYLIAGWNGTTTTISQLTNNGVYGNNGGSVFVGTSNAPGNVAIGSASGTTVAAGDNVTVEADNGYAQIGYAGAGDGNINVLATGNISVTDLYSNDTGFDPSAQIGNGGVNIAGNIGGNIDVQAGGTVTIEDDSYLTNCGSCNWGYALIGNLGGANSSESGNITVDSAGALSVAAVGVASIAQIGNGASVGAATSGGATGDITISSGDLTLAAGGYYDAAALIGDGGAFFANSGTTGGNIDINAASIDIAAAISANGGDEEARIANRGAGDVIGNYDISATGDIVLSADDGLALAAIGNGEGGSGTTSGNIDVTAGGSITLEATGEGEARIATTSDSNTNIDVTAGGDILLLDDNSSTNGLGYASVLIGSFGNDSGAASGNITVTSTNGSIELESSDSDGAGAFVEIGNSSGGNGNSGTITLSAPNGSVFVDSADATAYALIGNDDLGVAAEVSGDISVSAGDYIDIEGTNSVIGNAGTAGDVSGSVTLSAYDVAGFVTSLLNDIPNGNFTVINSGDVANDIDNTVIQYSSPYTFSYSTGGDLVVAASFQNSGSGAINVTAGGDILIGGPDAAGGVSVGSAGGTTTFTAANLTIWGDTNYAQLGYYGSGSGDVIVNTTGDLTLLASSDSECRACFAQIGNGGAFTSGDVGGDITLDVGGDLSLTGGEDVYSYAQIGNGGDTRGVGNDSGNIDVTVKGSASLVGTADFVQIGNGGYGADETDSGNVTLDVLGNLALVAGQEFGYVQIGNGGQFSSSNVSGAINVSAGGSLSMNSGQSQSYAQIGNGDGDRGNADGSVSGNISVAAGQAINLDNSDGGYLWIGNVSGSGGSLSGNVLITADTLNGPLAASFLNDIPNGNFTLDLTGTAPITLDVPLVYSSSYNATFSFGGNFDFAASVQNSGTGAIDITSGGTIIIGGSGAAGGVAVGSAGGTTTIHAANLVLAADNGYAQLGFNGSGNGAIDVATTGGVTLEGGSGIGDFTQIGDGGYQSSGSDGASITIAAGGNLTLDAGAGQFAYAQIGNGGADADANAASYSNSGTITVSAMNIALGAGSGNAAYVQIGNGGYEVGDGLTGKGTNGGDVSVTATDSIVLDGNGADAYAQIGNGGDLVNFNAAAGASGGNTGNITVSVTSGSGTLALAAGNGNDSFVQIGDGGYGENTPGATSSSFSTGGDVVVTVSNVSLTGSNSGSDAYAQIGNGDASSAGISDVFGDVTIAGIPTLTNGTASGASALIGNATGTGTVTGTTSGGEGSSAETVSTVTALVQGTQTTTTDEIEAIFQTPETQEPQAETEETDTGLFAAPLTPLEQMANASSNGDTSYEGEEPSDHLVASLGQSLDSGRGHKKTATVTVRTLVPGVLKQIVSYNARNPHGVPPADEDYSSWGNKALWQ